MKGIIRFDKPQIITMYNKKGNVIYKGDVYPSVYLVNATYIDGDYTPVDIKLNFIKKFLDKIPKKEKDVDLKFKDLKIYKDDKTKNFSISVHKKVIKYNPKFLKEHNMSFYDFIFVIGHELGHKLYYTEKYCDYIAFLYAIFNYIDLRFIRLNFLKNKERHEKFNLILQFFENNMNEIYKNL